MRIGFAPLALALAIGNAPLLPTPAQAEAPETTAPETTAPDPTPPPAALDAPEAQARLNQGQALYLAGRFTEAAHVFATLHRDSPPDVLAALDEVSLLGWLGSAQQEAGNPQEALATFRAALALIEGDPVPDPLALGLAHDNLSLLYLQIADRPMALYHAEEARRIGTEAFGPDHREVLIWRANHARILASLGLLAPAESALQEVVAQARDTPDLAPEDLAALLFTLASLHLQRQDGAKAEAILREAAALEAATLPADHPAHAATLNDLAIAILLQGRIDEALALLVEVISVTGAALGPDHPNTAAAHLNLALALAEADRPAAARPEAALAAEMFQRHFGPSHPATLQASALLRDIDRALSRLPPDRQDQPDN